MRAFFLENFDEYTEEIIIDDYQHHHFVHVLRGKSDENVIVINGKGLKICGKVSNISKKKLVITVDTFSHIERKIKTEIAIGVPKKDYLIDILRMSTEIGVAAIHLIETERTPWKFKYNDRFDKVVMAALLQSNNLYMPNICIYKNLNEFIKKLGDKKVMAFSTEIVEESNVRADIALVGPEGGFSKDEVKLLINSENILLTTMPNPIMKSVTAVPFTLGRIQ